MICQQVQFFQMGSSNSIIFNNFKIDNEKNSSFTPLINTHKWKIWILHMYLGLLMTMSYYQDNDSKTFNYFCPVPGPSLSRRPLLRLLPHDFPPDTRYLQNTQPIHIQTPITTKTSVLAMHSPQKSYPLLQVLLKTELFTIILTASSIMFIQSKKKKNYLPAFSLKPLL